MTTVLNGLLGGLVAATLVELGTRGLGVYPASATDAERPDGPRATLARLLAGGVAGGLLVGLELSVLGVLSVPPDLGAALLVSVAWSGALFGLSVAWTAVATGRRPRRTELLRRLGTHLAFGVALGLWIRATWVT